MPVYVGLFHLKPHVVEFVASRDEPAETVERVRANTRSILPGAVVADRWYTVDAYRVEGAEEACQDIVARHPASDVVFNITGGSKMMAIGAYLAALSGGADAIYIDTAHSTVHSLLRGHAGEVELRLSFEQYARCCEREVPRHKPLTGMSVSEQKALEAAHYLATLSPEEDEVLAQVRASTQGAAPLACSISRSPAAERVLRALEEYGIVKDVGVAQEDISFEIHTDGDMRFVKGAWLELFVWDQARRLVGAGRQPLFDECVYSVELPAGDAVKEVDVACMYRAQLVWSSCKTGRKPFQTAYLDEVRAVSDLLGGRFCTPLFVAAAYLRGRDEEASFRDQARQREIVVVSREDFPRVGDILRKQALNPDFPRR
jgi:hypothetical protein